MSNRRQKLHEILVGILGSRNVYFQPPSNTKMQYPCIIYKRNKIDTKFANDKSYNGMFSYSVVIIDPNPDSEIHVKVGALPLSKFDRHYTTDNLNHDIYNIYH